jgi:hypothetical protein
VEENSSPLHCVNWIDFGEEIRDSTKKDGARKNAFQHQQFRFVPATFGNFATNIAGHNRQTWGSLKRQGRSHLAR